MTEATRQPKDENYNPNVEMLKSSTFKTLRRGAIRSS